MFKRTLLTTWVLGASIGFLLMNLGCGLRSQMMHDRMVERNELWIGRSATSLLIQRGEPDYKKKDPTGIEYWTYETTKHSGNRMASDLDRDTLDQQMREWTESVTFVIGIQETIESIETRVE